MKFVQSKALAESVDNFQKAVRRLGLPPHPDFVTWRKGTASPPEAGTASVGALVGASVGASVGVSVGASVGERVGNLVCPVGAPVGALVGALVGGIGIQILPRLASS